MKLKDMTVNIFITLARDENLLTLLEVPTREMKDIREQIIEDRYPRDLIDNNLSRLCVFEMPSSPTINPIVERGWVEVDIYVTKEKNKIDRRSLLIAERLVELLHNTKIAGTGLNYYNRLANLQSDSQEWVKYGVVFSYDNIILRL